MKALLKMPDVSKLAERYQTAAEEMDAVAEECVSLGADHLLERFRARLEEHRRTGAAVESLVRKPLVREGNRVSIDVGAFYDKEHRQGFLHALYQEYGTPTFEKDPWLRPEVDGARTELNKKYRAVFKRHGYGEVK